MRLKISIVFILETTTHKKMIFIYIYLFSSIFPVMESLPDELIFTILTTLNINEALNLCATDKHFSKFCQDWRIILSYKYPQTNWSHTSSEDALKIYKKVEEGITDDLFIWASQYGYIDLVKMLLEDKRVNPAANDNFAIRLASRNGYTEVVKVLLADLRVDPCFADNHAIRWASKNGHTEIFKLLLKDSRVDLQHEDNYAIRWASRNGHTEIVQLLLADSKVNPAAKNNWAIKWASRYGHTEVVKLLKEHQKSK